MRSDAEPDRRKTSASLLFPAFHRKVRTAFNKLEKTGLIRKVEGSRGGYVLNPDGGKGILNPLTAD